MIQARTGNPGCPPACGGRRWALAAVEWFRNAVLRPALRVRQGVLLLCVLAAGIPGCDDPGALAKASSDITGILAIPLWIPVIVVEVDQWARDKRGPPRQLHAIRARVTDAIGKPLEATLTVRVADRYTAAPEHLTPTTYQITADGEFAVVIGQRKAVCVDVTAAGMQPKRKWFIVLYEGVGKTWPEDPSEIIPLNGSYEMDGRTAIQMDAVEP